MRVLCLHGLDANARVLEAQLKMGGWQAAGMVLECLDAPHERELAKAPEVVRQFFGCYAPFRGWFDCVDGVYEGLEDSLKLLVGHMKKHGPYDGLLGFSQGAHMAVVLAQEGLLDVRFVLALSGRAPRFGARGEASVALRAKPSPVPTLALTHDGDDVVPLDDVQALAACFAPSRTASVPGTQHKPVRYQDVKAEVQAFLADLPGV